MIKYTVDEFRRNLESIPAMFDRPAWTALENVYGVPRGGTVLATALSFRPGFRLLGSLTEPHDPDKTLVVDDIVDSGATALRYMSNGYRFLALLGKDPISSGLMLEHQDHIRVKAILKDPKEWVEFWWEETEGGAEDNVRRILQYLGEDVSRDGLKETPSRVARSWDEIYGGYTKDPKEVFKVFDNESYDQMVLLKDIEFYSTCEHHMQPFFGKAHIAYIPRKGFNSKVIGVSKMARLLEIFSRRLQIQERIGEQVVTALMHYLNPEGAACLLEAQHLCMCARGVNKQTSVMTTSSLRGAFKDNAGTRAELFSMIYGRR